MSETTTHGVTEHGADCACVRCTGFTPGHALSTRHGSWGTISLRPRARELAAAVAELAPVRSDADGPAIDLAGVLLGRVERAASALEESEADGQELDARERLSKDLRLWIEATVKLLDKLGMTPTSRADLGLTVAQRDLALERANVKRLTPAERETLFALLEKVEPEVGS